MRSMPDRVVLSAAKIEKTLPPWCDAGPANPQKNRTGFDRAWHALGYSLADLRAGWFETAFRQEAIASIAMVPAAFWLAATGSKLYCSRVRSSWS